MMSAYHTLGRHTYMRSDQQREVKDVIQKWGTNDLADFLMKLAYEQIRTRTV